LLCVVRQSNDVNSESETLAYASDDIVVKVCRRIKCHLLVTGDPHRRRAEHMFVIVWKK